MKEINSLRENDGDWYVLHVRPRCEKKVAAYCANVCRPSYLPLRLEKKKYQRRRVETWKPLFPGYVFVRFRPEQRISVLQSGQIARILEVKDQPKFINEIEQIRKALSADPALQACPALTAGMTVRITAGPFQGLEGIVVKIKGQSRVVLNVAMIGQGVAIEADEEVLEVL
jgi:transcription antitermination factor NusG